MSEKTIQTAILRYLNRIPCCIAENVSGNASQSGRADINGCYRGRAFKIEVKTDPKVYGVTKQQELYLKKWSAAGAATAVCTSVADVQQFLEGINEIS